METPTPEGHAPGPSPQPGHPAGESGGYGSYGYGPPAGQPAPPRRSRAGGVFLGVLAGLLLLALVSCCALASSLGSLGRGAGAGGIGAGPGVAVIHLTGTISDGSSDSQAASPERFIKLLRKAEKDDDVKAVLIRINSPGGTVSASQEMAMEVARMRKPVIADIGDTGASGAYYVASQCDTIVATPSSAVGSIGVILEVPNVEELMKKLGIKVTVIHEGTLKDVGSPFRSMTPTETKLVQRSLRPAYDEFIRDVARGRKLPESRVREMATGFFWPGVTAKEMGLVDVIGNYSDALRVAGHAGGLGDEPRVIEYDQTDVFGLLGRLVSGIERLGGPGADALRNPGTAR